MKDLLRRFYYFGCLLHKKLFDFDNFYFTDEFFSKFYIFLAINGQRILKNTNIKYYKINIVAFYNYSKLSLVYFRSSFILKKILFFFLLKYKSYLFYHHFFIFRVFKMHGINMRLKRIGITKFFLRVGYSHGFLFDCLDNIKIKIYKNRYFFIIGFNIIFLNFISVTLRNLRKFFKYKLIGIKLSRDHFIIKVGKKKVF
jgi:hypothetical protein